MHDNPRDVYNVDGLRGEVIRFESELRLDGDLDPVLGIFDDSDGQMALFHDDSEGTTGRLS